MSLAPPERRPAACAAFALGSALLFASRHGGLLAHDAQRVVAVTVGKSRALAACEGLDASNSGRARAAFPRPAVVHSRTRVAGGIGQAPASDRDGNLIIAHGEPRLSKLDAQGQSMWSVRLPSEASSSPVLLANGSILVVTRDADALLFQPGGKLAQQRALPLADLRHRVLSIPTVSGGALVASGSVLLELDAQAEVIRRLRARGTVTALAQARAEVIVIAENGSVEEAGVSGELELIGSLGGSAPEGGALQNGKVWAVVDSHQLVTLDLATGQRLTVATDFTSTFTGPLALFEDRGAVFVADGGFVSVRARDGTERARVSVAGTAQAFDPAARGLRAASLISDRAGGVLAVRGASDALLIAEDGALERLAGTACLDPYRPTPTRAGIVLACRSGQLFFVGNDSHEDH